VQQSLRGLIDGKGAEVDLRPRLTINTDEIQATHGATTGRLDDNLLFYLLARGIDDARRALAAEVGFPRRSAGCDRSAGAATRRRLRRRGAAQRRAGAGALAVSAALPLLAAEYATPDGRLQPERVRADFPILGREIHGRPLVYLDSAASSQQPRTVLDAVTRYGEWHHANVHRGVHTLSQEATAAFEGARETVRALHQRPHRRREIIFTRGTTEAINLVAQSWGGSQLRAGDEVLITQLEHHANIVPWQMACARAGARSLPRRSMPRRSRPRGLCRPPQPAHAPRCVGACLQCAGHRSASRRA
jgi:hypothetical protein